MRILAVRGKNLASLERFEVDFDQGLGGSGLFAITGPTGAGKSTLLDAICLPLFNQTPRLGARSLYSVGAADGSTEEGLGAYDVRSILRRGAGEGMAEVDLIADDGVRYRARWTVRRARKKATGRYQKVALAFEDLDQNLPLGGKIKETLQCIEQTIGLTFEQFCRSVLLAQGDFAAFLKAGEKDRADLLERMTGTEIYGQLSKAAHRRAASLAQELDEAARLLEERAPLEPEERQQLEQQLAGRQAAVDGLSKRKQELDAYAETTRRAQELQGEIARGREQMDRAAQAREEADLALRSIERMRRVLSVVEVNEAEERLQQLHGDLEALASNRAQLARWREDHAELEPLSVEWPHWRAVFDALESQRQQLAEAQGKDEPLAEAQVVAAAHAHEAEDRLQEATAELARAEGAEQLAAQTFDADALDAVDEEVAQGQRRASALQRLAQHLETAARSDAAVGEARAGIEALEAEVGRLSERHREQTEQLGKLDAELDAAERGLTRTRAAMSLEARRAELEHGEPCPLCGSTEHPYAGETFERLASEAEAEVAAIKQRRSALVAELTELSTRLADRKATVAERSKILEQQHGERATALDAWRGAAEPLGLPSHALDATAASELARQTAHADKLLEELSERKKALVERRKELDARRQDSRRALATREAAREAAEKARAKARNAEQAVKDNRDAMARARTAIEERRRELETPLSFVAGWWTLYEEDPAAFRRARAAEAEQWSLKLEALEKTTREQAVQAAREEGLARDAEQARLACLEQLGSEAIPDELRNEAADWVGERLRGLTGEGRSEVLAAARRDNRQRREAATRQRHDADRQMAGEQAALELRERELDAVEEKRVQLREAMGISDEEALDDKAAKLAEELGSAQHDLDETRLALRQDDQHRDFHRAEGARLEARRAEAERWRKLDELIGSADGGKFRKFAQNLTLAQVLAQANHRLQELAPRYRLQAVPGRDLELQMLDCDMGNEIRSIASLSGGESFLVSLALALGLASLSAQRIRVESMFIDEGFGSLDPDTLDVALATLDSLQATGRQIGIISHVAGLAERIGRQVRVDKRGGGRSRVSICGR